MRIEAALAEMRSAALRRDFNEFDRLADKLTVYFHGVTPPQTEDPMWGRFGLTVNEGRILDCLLRSKGRVVTREAIMNAVYFDRPHEEPDIKIIDIFICKARKKLQEATAPFWIETHWGRGYSLNEGKIPVTHRYAGQNNRHRWHRVHAAA